MTHGAWLDSFGDVAAEVGESASLAALAAAVALGAGMVREEATLLARLIAPGIEPDPTVVAALTPPRSLSNSTVLGLAKSSLVPRATRKSHGVHFTPSDVASGLSGVALRGLDRDTRVCDPTVGAGAFLLAAADCLVKTGASPDAVIAEGLFGADSDPVSVAVARTSLGLWGWKHLGRVVVPPASHLVVGDPLTEGTTLWPSGPPPGFDAVLGNPPFLGQLKSATARDPARARDLATTRGSLAKGYVDDAGLFLVTALDLAQPGGRVALILPQSLLTTRDGEAVRAEVMRRATLRGIWIADDVDFAAAVRVWAPILEVHRGSSPHVDNGDRGEDPGHETRSLAPGRATKSTGTSLLSGLTRPEEEVARFTGMAVVGTTSVPMVLTSRSWAPLIADLLGGLAGGFGLGSIRTRGTLASMATATAGFRTQFYGLIPFVCDAPLNPAASGEPQPDPRTTAPLITAGAIDPLHDRSSTTPTRFAGSHFARPVIDLAALREHNPSLAAWVQARRRPKVLVAPQAAVIEALLDGQGDLVPSTPVVSVEPNQATQEQAALVAAVLCAPVSTAWAYTRAAGSGLGRGTMRVPAKALLDLPLPVDDVAWTRGASLVVETTAAASSGDATRWETTLDTLGRTMNMAFGLEEDHEVFAWWRARRPSWRP